MASKITRLIGVWFLEWCVVFFYVLCYVSRPMIHLFLQMLKYVLPYKCNCIMISNTSNFFLTLKNRPICWRTLYIVQKAMLNISFLASTATMSDIRWYKLKVPGIHVQSCKKFRQHLKMQSVTCTRTMCYDRIQWCHKKISGKYS